MRPYFVYICILLVSTLSLAQSNPVPFIVQPLVPMSAAPGGSGFTLTVNGAGFVSASVVNWSGSSLPTTFVSKTQLTATVAASDIATAHTAWVTVSNPAPGGGTSNVAFFQIASPLPTVVFGAPIDTGAVGFSVVVADFNGDGKLDLATTGVDSQNNPTLYIQMGNGDGTFHSPVAYPIYFPPIITAQIVTGDFNGDGKLDLVAGLSVLLGNGDGTFRLGGTLPSQYQGVGEDIVAGDFNGDGKLDLAALEDSYYLFVMLGNGDGTFEALPPIQVGSPMQSAFDLAAADFNGDGVLDLAVDVNWLQFNGPATFDVLLGNGDGTFQSVFTYTTALSTGGDVAADFNGDGKQDLATGNSFGLSQPPFTMYTLDAVSLGNGDGTFDFNPNGFIASGSVGIPTFSGDFNADGKLDIAVGSAIALGNGDGTFQTPPITLSSIGPPYTAGDLNGDGRLDLIGMDEHANVFVELQTVSPVVKVSPSSLDFAMPQLVGTASAPQIATLSNSGNATLSITSIGIVGAHADNFAETNNCGHTLAPNGSCQISVTFAPVEGGRQAGLQITDNAPGSPQGVGLIGTLQDFSLTVTSQTSLTVAPGQFANYSISASPVNGFAQKIELSCGAIPAQSTCTVTPSSVTLDGSHSATANLAVATAGASPGLTQPAGGPPNNNRLALWAAFSGALGLAFLMLIRCRREWRPQLLYGVTLLCLLSIGVTMLACGGGGSSGGGTQAGTYTPTVTGTFTSGSAKLTHSLEVTLIVR